MISDSDVATHTPSVGTLRVAADRARGPGPLSIRDRRNSVVLIVVLLLVGVFALYWRTTLSMVAIWERSETFAHGFVVIPIFCYLLWRRRDALAALEPGTCWGAVLGIAAAGFFWFVGELVNAASVSQFAMVVMVPFAVWAVLGTRIAMALLIPLAFLFFAVPLGDFLVPTLIDWTAHFTVTALRASGVPVYQEGNFFAIPSGMWSVVEACSGLRYLIASLMVGCLYAYLSYRSTARRVAFIVASLVVPIVANWLRAYMIVMLAYLSSNLLAVGVDHLIYGWIFFGLVMALLFWIGSRWREDEPVLGDNPSAHDRVATDVYRSTGARGRPLLVVIAALVVIAMWQPLLAHFDTSANSSAVRLAPITGRDGWTSTSDEISAWRPDLSGSRAEIRQTFEKDRQRVGLHIEFYRGQTSDAKAISSTNLLVGGANQVWRQIDAGVASMELDGSGVRARTGVVVRPGERLAVWQWYWVDGHITSNEYVAKLRQAVSMFRGNGDSVAWVVIYAPDKDEGVQSGASLRQFAAAMRGPIEDMLREAASTQ